MAVLVSDVYDMVRSMVGDKDGDAASDDVLFPFVQKAYRKTARALRAYGVGLFKKQSSSITVTVGTTAISRSVAPTYPTDLLRPIELRERPASAGTFKTMRSSDGFLPDQAAVSTLQVWDWRNDTIYLIGATVDTLVQIQYEAELAALTGPESPILIPDALDPVARMTCSDYARARDEMNHAEKWWEQAMEDIEQIARGELGAKAGRGVRMGSQ